MSDIDNHDEDEDAVTLMTMHSAKGLEFPVVFIPGMENGMFPGISAFEDSEKMEEERRLCYVGITRAMNKLYLTGAQVRTMYGRTEWQTESMFLDEMDRKCLDGDCLVKDRTNSGQTMLGDYIFAGRMHGTADGYFGEPKPKPFDSLSAARRATKNKEKISNEFENGDIVRHPKFGEGMVIKTDGRIAEVAFDTAGIKKLAIDVAPIKKI
jgi:DNA helicase-2/ATP-dependent DNA helicase PcrA